MLTLLVTGVFVFAPGRGQADRGLGAMWDSGQVTAGGIVYPNWQRIWVASFEIQLWDTNDAPENLAGLTVANFGTADSGDIAGVYWEVPGQGGGNCGGVPLQTMTYAGIYVADDGTPSLNPAWTWAGLSPDLSDCIDPIGGATFVLNVYADVSSCPEHGATINMGFPINQASNTYWWGSITDQLPASWGSYSAVPWAHALSAGTFYIQYVYKVVDKEQAAPGDTLTYTIYYGRPGTAAFSDVEIMDTQPPYTHYVVGSGVPAPDPGWDPDPGPPLRLRWSLPGGNIGNGYTSEVRFQVTIDWGNGEGFEPGSGDIAAPERQRLYNQAQAFWNGLTGCGTSTIVSSPAQTIAKRFLFWKIADNDMLFAGMIGQPDDEIVYEIFLKNLSATKTWWRVNIWDTVPNEVDVWGPGYGMEDPFLGWTMTPSGAAAANAGVVLNAGKTILTWRTDLPPRATLAVRWKSKVKTTVPPDSQATNIASVIARGRPGVVDGTGHSVNIANFTHVAKILLRTTYYSYTSFGGSQDLDATKYLLPFFPLNKQTNFELRKLEYNDDASVAGLGGKSDSINVFVGSCVGGFADAGFSHAGCKVERAPACYWPSLPWIGAFLLLYKVTSNSPILWQTMSWPACSCHDSHTFAPATTLSFRGFTHYMAMRPDQDCLDCAGHGDRLAILNTGMDANDSFDPNRDTTVHIFDWNRTNLSWDYLRSGDIAGESFWVPFEGTYATAVNISYYYRVISSDAQNLIYQGYHTMGVPGIGGAFDNYSGLSVNRENGGFVNETVPANFYLLPRHVGDPIILVGNTGAAQASYRIWKYKPDISIPRPNFPATLAGSSGSWVLGPTHTVDPGFPVPGNAHVYGNQAGWDRACNGAISAATPWKFELLGGGPIQIIFGTMARSGCAGAACLHDADGTQWGDDFWLHNSAAWGGCGDAAKGYEKTLYVNVFCPKEGMAVSVNSTGGWTATYTTDGPDQCIVFMKLTDPDTKGVPQHNYHFFLNPAGETGDLIAQYHQSSHTEKAFTAPFVATGTHYRLFAPPVVFSGQNYWLTVVVIENGVTKTNYDGTTSFSATDPATMIMGTPMDGYDYVWAPASDEGVKLFINVRMDLLGLQSIVAMDTLDGSITGLTTVMVVGVDVKLTKEPRLQIAASGDEIQFKICWSNYSTATAANFVVTDEIPNGFTYVQGTVTSHFCGATSGFGAATVAYSTTGNNPGDYQTMPGAGVATATWLRWTIPQIGVLTTGCVCFKAKVD